MPKVSIFVRDVSVLLLFLSFLHHHPRPLLPPLVHEHAACNVNEKSMKFMRFKQEKNLRVKGRVMRGGERERGDEDEVEGGKTKKVKLEMYQVQWNAEKHHVVM
jgi:hypothetical protein